MKLFLDSAIVDEIKEALDLWDIDGITTNPRHVATAGKPFMKVIKEIAKLVENTDKTVSVEVNPHFFKCDEIVTEAKKLASISPNFVIKIQTSEQTFKAIRLLNDEGIRCNCTLVFSAAQALQAMRSNAYYVSPFIGWKESNGEEWIPFIDDCVTIRDTFGYETEIIVAAVRNGRQIVDAAAAGADIVTAGLAVYKEAFEHPYTKDGIAKFTSFWDKTLYE
jgi:transaldolase